MTVILDRTHGLEALQLRAMLVRNGAMKELELRVELKCATGDHVTDKSITDLLSELKDNGRITLIPDNFSTGGNKNPWISIGNWPSGNTD
jgi:hypothetical protein